MKQLKRKGKEKRSIFRSLFVPLFLIMVLQAGIFYFAAVYGGIEESLSQNAADILAERLLNRKNELETTFTNDWINLGTCTSQLDQLYASYEQTYGSQPLLSDPQLQVDYLSDASQELIGTLRQNKVNGIYLILNDQPTKDTITEHASDKKYGLCIRDLDQNSNYTDTADLLLQRSPSSIIEQIGCSLDSWWEAQYSFSSIDEGSFYFSPLEAVFDNPGVSGDDLAYFAGPHSLNGSGQEVISYSIPLISSDGFAYGVVGIEITTKYLTTLLPGNDQDSSNRNCYVLALQDASSTECIPIVTSGSLYNQCFSSDSILSTADTADIGGFTMTGRGNILLYGNSAPLSIYNNNNPFDSKQLVLLTLAESRTMFSYIDHIKQVLMLVALISLFLGLVCILLVSRHFASPITALAKKVRTMKPQAGFKLDRLGITEIDQLVDSIETLNHNVSKDIARTEFFSRMSHDMRTPMNAIISFSSPELLEDADEDQKDNYLNKIHSSGEYLLGLINEVLDMTKIESNKMELQYSPLQINRAWETIIPIIEKLAQKKSLNFVKDIPDRSDLYLYVDGQHLNQILMNLLSNAVKFTPENGTIRLQVRLKPTSEESDMVDCNVVIQDNGIGISQDFIKDLYTPFEQEHEGKEGTGLGLSIAKKLVEMMNGTIQCDSTKGIGTTFTICIPMKICESADDYTKKSSSHEEDDHDLSARTDKLEGKHFLICEDHPLNTQIICRLLERKKITYTTASDGAEGLQIFTQMPPGSFDAILMDIRMPNMDGLTATAAIRALPRPDARVIPIIAMTANAFSEDVQASRAAGMDAHLSKPIEPNKLYETLESFFVS
ncbi:MAG: response regulator [Clostridia bacterium]|nr:response regulator [Clostridia bacterium]